MAMYYNGKKVRNLYYNGKCITRLALGKEMTRLVEGDDFVRAEWLVGDGTAYIDTLHLANEGLEWETHVSNLSFKKYFVWNRVAVAETPAISLYHSSFTNGAVRIQNNYTNNIELQNQTNCDYIVATNSNGAVINGVQYIRQSASEGVSNKSIKLFYCDIDIDGIQLITNNGGNSQNVKCSYFRFIDANGTTIQDLVPCRLLRPIPASLDANGIARNAGECGMYNSVNGLFYGNVGSGSFTVEPSLIEGVDYEVHRWLVGDGSVYLYLGEVQNYIEFDVDLQQEVKTDVFIYGYNGQIRYGYNGQTIIVLAPENRIKYYNVPLQGTIRVDFSTHYVYFNGEQFGHTDLGTLSGGNDENFFKKAYFFGFEQFPSFRSRYFSLGNVNMDGSNFTPCRLLRPLPSYLDANGKARHQFECGMLNLKTMKFYGNVNTSGNFFVSDN